MEFKFLSKDSWYLISLLAGIVIFAVLFPTIVEYLVISAILSAILKTPTNYINHLTFLGISIPRSAAILCSYVLLVSLLTIFILLFVPLVTEQIEVLSQTNIETLVNHLSEPVGEFEKQMIRFGIAKANEEEGFLLYTIVDNLSSFIEKLHLGDLINQLIAFTSNFFVGTLAVLFITFFILLEKGFIRKQIISLIPNKYFEVSIGALYKIEKMLSNYLLGLLLQLFTMFVIRGIGLFALDIEYAITIALFASIVHIVPFIGPIVGTIFGVMVVISVGNAAEIDIQVFKVLIVFGVAQLVDNIILQTLIFSKSVKAHPLEIFLVIFAGAELSGALGMILAIPAYTIIKVSVVEFYKGSREYRIFKKSNLATDKLNINR